MSRLSRRGFLWGAAGFVLGGGLVGAAGLAYRELRQRRFVSAHSSMVTLPHRADNGWLLSAEDRAELAAAEEIAASEVLEVREATDLSGDDLR